MKQKIVDRIAFKLVVWLFIFSSILTILGTFGQLYFDYTEDVKRAAASVNTVTLHQLPELRRIVRSGDSDSVNSLLYNLVKKSGVAYAAVIMEEKIAWQQGKKITGKHVCSRFPLDTIDGEQPQSGILEVMVDCKQMWQQLTNRSVQALVTNGIKIFLISGFVFLMFQYLVTRHLESLARQIGRFDFSKPYLPLRLERKGKLRLNELELVVSGLNTMQEKAREAYESLANNEQRLLHFFDSTEEAIVGLDRDGICSFANDACLGLLGFSEYEAVIGKELHALFIHAKDRMSGTSAEECIVLQSMDEGRALQCEDGFLVTRNRQTVFVSLRSYPVFKEGEVSGAIVFIKDNSETRQLRHERLMLSEAIRQAPLMIIIADHDNLVQYVNPGTESLTGFSKQELIGRSVLQLNNSTMDPEMKLSDKKTTINTTLKNGQKWEGIIEIHSKNGTPLKLFSVISPIFDEKNRVVNTISVSREVSYEIALQDELVNAKKMEAVGRLSASFAHEFGNPLFGVRSVLKDVCDRIEFSEEDQRLIELACLQCERMREMVRDFRQFYRDSTGGEEMQGIDTIVRKILTNVDALRQSAQVTVVLTIVEETCEMFVDKNKLSLVLNNIIVNALESMVATGGRLEISVLIEGENLVVLIRDTGVGIRRENLDLIFEPFFSTKPAVEGAGLGLSVAYGTMKNLGGTITVVSEEGRGALFSVTLPIN